MSRQQSPAPPSLPPKDPSSSLTSSSFHSSKTNSRYINSDLADAVRDSVLIRSSANSPQPGQVDFSASTQPIDNSRLARQPSFDLLVPRRTPSPNVISQTYTTGVIDNRMSFMQPQLPSQRMVSAQNPFETDNLEPLGPSVRPSGDGRGKLARAQTGLATSSSSANLLQTSPTAKTRPRRSMSSGSYGIDSNGKELTAGQKKALEDKKGGRHADVIDTWDPTGLGSAMWHHAGPYDAAAPSRNQNLPNTKAPMRAFTAQQAAAAQAAAKENKEKNGRSGSISLAAGPTPPAKDHNDGPTKRAQAVLDRKPTAARRTSGGLTGQYSTSMPTSGGYFPDMNEPVDEAALARRERERQREEKRRALKAAWGTDTPEPFEDFGVSPNEVADVDLHDDFYSPESDPIPLPGRSARSPGIRFGPGTTPPILEDIVSPAEYGQNYPTRSTAPASGVKRTKSLMQKIKTMVRTRTGSIEDAEPVPPVTPRFLVGQRSQSMSANLGYARPAHTGSPGWSDQDVVEVDEDGREEDVFTTRRRPRSVYATEGKRIE